jgi:hypothetical protein
MYQRLLLMNAPLANDGRNASNQRGNQHPTTGKTSLQHPAKSISVVCKFHLCLARQLDALQPMTSFIELGKKAATLRCCPRQTQRQPHGRPGGTRTPNTRFWRPVLYQLNYWPRAFSTTKPNLLGFVVKLTYFNDFGNNTSTNCTTTFTDSEAQTFFHRDWVNQFYSHLTLSPGITISTPSGSSIEPVTSVVRK